MNISPFLLKWAELDLAYLYVKMYFFLFAILKLGNMLIFICFVCVVLGTRVSDGSDKCFLRWDLEKNENTILRVPF